MPQTKTDSIVWTFDMAEDVDDFAGLGGMPLTGLAPERVKALADRVMELDRRRDKVDVASFNSSI